MNSILILRGHCTKSHALFLIRVLSSSCIANLFWWVVFKDLVRDNVKKKVIVTTWCKKDGAHRNMTWSMRNEKKYLYFDTSICVTA